MSRGINKVILVGNLGDDPEIVELNNDGILAKLSLATGEAWTDKATGERREKTEWHRVVIFGPLADVAEQWLTKGSQVYIEGKLHTRSWEDDSGQTRYATEVLIDGFSGTLVMLGGQPQGQQQQQQQQQGGWGQPQQPQQQPQQQSPQQRQQRQPQSRQNALQTRSQPQQQQRAPQQRQPRSNRQQAPQQQYQEPPMEFDDEPPF